MRKMITYDIYICHSGTLTDSYKQLMELLNAPGDFRYRNHSEDWTMPPLKYANSRFLTVYKKMQRNMNGSACVVMLLDRHCRDTGKRRYEADYAAASRKPLIVVNTDGSDIPTWLSPNAVTDFERGQIIAAIEKYALYI